MVATLFVVVVVETVPNTFVIVIREKEMQLRRLLVYEYYKTVGNLDKKCTILWKELEKGVV